MRDMRTAPASERHLGALLVVGGCLPFAAGAIAGEGSGLPCPFRAATRLPCPLCGSSRAFALATGGDADLFRFNAAWVALAALAVLAGLAGLAASLAGRAPLTRARAWLTRVVTGPARVVAMIALVAALPWAYALAQRETIAGG
jgi:hypothetical protein